MRKRFTKIICAATAVISAAALACAPACSVKFGGVNGKDEFAAEVSSNGGFVVETGEGDNGYVYFVNGKAANTDDNTFGSVVKGSVQRIKKSDLLAHNESSAYNYSSTETVVPSLVYSGSYNAGIYIYGDYIYYTTPSTQRDADGNVLNGKLDFKRTSLDGKVTSDGYIWQSSDNTVDYRFVKVGDVVYIIYALSENLYGTTATNVHSVNCETGEDVLLAYNVAEYAFDTENVENPYVYYTMKPTYTGSGDEKDYNQIFRVRADATQSPREYDFSDVEDYNAEEDPLYVNYGDYVFDGIGLIEYNSGRLSQFNYGYPDENKSFNVRNDDYTYKLDGYKNGVLYYTRTGRGESSLSSLFTLTDAQVDADNDGRVDAGWNAIELNASQKPFIYGFDDTDYIFYKMKDKADNVEKTYAINTSGSISKAVINGEGKVETALTISTASAAKVLGIKEEKGNVNLYYLAADGTNGNALFRIAIDGDEDDYRKLSTEIEPDKTLVYRSVKVLDADICSDWYLPEFVGDTLMFAGDGEGMTDFNYIMACDLTGADGRMTNKEITAYNEQLKAVTDKIDAYDEVENTDSTTAYKNLTAALKYLYYTRDVAYLNDLKQAYIDIEGKTEDNNIYSAESIKIYNSFINVEGEWKTWKKDGEEVEFASRTINGEKVYSNTRDYYYSVVGKVTEADSKAISEHFRTADAMPQYPVDNSTWWEKLSTGGKVGFIIGMVAAGLLVIGGAVVLTVVLVKRRKNRHGDADKKKRMDVDITDDKDMNVYDDGENS